MYHTNWEIATPFSHFYQSARGAGIRSASRVENGLARAVVALQVLPFSKWICLIGHSTRSAIDWSRPGLSSAPYCCVISSSNESHNISLEKSRGFRGPQPPDGCRAEPCDPSNYPRLHVNGEGVQGKRRQPSPMRAATPRTPRKHPARDGPFLAAPPPRARAPFLGQISPRSGDPGVKGP